MEMEEKEKAADDNDFQQQEHQKVSKDCIMPSAHEHLTFIALQEQNGITRKEDVLIVDCLILELLFSIMMSKDIIFERIQKK